MLILDGPGLLRVTERERPGDIVVTRPFACCGLFRHAMPPKNDVSEVMDRWMQPMSYVSMTINNWIGVMGFDETEKVSPSMIIKAMAIIFGARSTAKGRQWTVGQEWFMDQHYIRYRYSMQMRLAYSQGVLFCCCKPQCNCKSTGFSYVPKYEYEYV
jgi:hypothetical protein